MECWIAKRALFSLLWVVLLTGAVRAQDNSENEGWVVWLAVGVGAGLGIVLLACAVALGAFLCCRYYRHKETPADDNDEDLLMDDETSSNVTENILMSEVSQTSFLAENYSWEIKMEDLSITNELGRDVFGRIYDAELHMHNGQLSRALVKTFEGGDFNRFREEVEMLKMFQHSRVGRLYGVVCQSFPYHLVLELPLLGDLKTFLTKIKKTGELKMETRDLVKMTFDVACGLEYCHCSIGYVHSDVAARNCMVTQKLIVKITDYNIGPALFKKEYCRYKNMKDVPVRWLPPETFLHSIYDYKTNVWSYGVLFWEVMTFCIMPYMELSNSEVPTAIMDIKRRLLKPKNCPSKLFEFIENCWHEQPILRPDMTVVCQELDKYLAVTKERHVQHSQKNASNK